MDDVKGPDSSAEQVIPKSRFDEVNGERNELKKQTQFLQQLVMNQQQQQQRRAPVPPNARLEKLKVEDPEMYELLVSQERKLRQQSAHVGTLADQIDKKNFLDATGSVGKKRAAEVEEILEAERQKGNWNVTRMGIFNWKLGEEKLQEELRRPLKSDAPVAPGEEASVEEHDAPPSNPKLATTVSGSKGASRPVEKSRDERIAELKDVEF